VTRPWGRLLAATLTHRKYLRSSHEDRSAWLTLLLASFNSPSDDDLGCRADVEATLRALGHRHPGQEVDRLLELGWLDEREGHFWLHDWQEHQPVDPTGAKRKARSRSGSWSRDVTGQSPDSHVTVTGMSRARGHNMSRARGEESREEENLEGRESTSSGLAPARARAGDDADPAYSLRQWLAANGAPVRDGDGYHAKLVRLVATDSGKTCGDVIAAFERLKREGARTARQYVLGAENALFPISSASNGKAPARSLSDVDFDAGMIGDQAQDILGGREP
jgi:hypothetical protein